MLDQLPMQVQNDPLNAPLLNGLMEPQQNDQVEENRLKVMPTSQLVFDTVQASQTLSEKEQQGRLDEMKKQKNAYSWIGENRTQDAKAFASSQGYQAKAMSYARRSAVPFVEGQAVQRDATADLSKRERSKLKSRQKSDLKKAKKRGLEGATGDVFAYVRARTSANRWIAENEEKLNSEASMMVDDNTLTAVFGGTALQEKYKNRNDPPYDIKDLMQRLDMADRLQAVYKENVANKNRFGFAYVHKLTSLEKQAEMAALQEMSNKLRETVNTIMTANGVTIKGARLKGSDVAEKAQRASAKAIAEYNALTQNLASVQADKLCTMLEQPEYKDSSTQLAYENGLNEEYQGDIKEAKKKLDPVAAQNLENVSSEFADSRNATAYVKSLELVNQNPDGYKQNKVVVDKLFQQLKDSYSYISHGERKSKEVTHLFGQYGGASGDNAVHEAVKKKYTTNDETYNLHKENTKMCESMISAILNLDASTLNYHILVQQKYGITTERLKANTTANLYTKSDKLDSEGKTKSAYAQFLEEKPVKGKETEYLLARLNRPHARQANLLSYIKKFKLPGDRNDEFLLLCPGYDTDANGQPLTAQDVLDKAESERILDDFGSKEHKKIIPKIEAMIKEVISYKIDMNEFSDDKFLGNVVKLKKMTNKFASLDNFLTDYPWLYEELDPILIGAAKEISRGTVGIDEMCMNKLQQLGVYQKGKGANDDDEYGLLANKGMSDEQIAENAKGIEQNMQEATVSVEKYLPKKDQMVKLINTNPLQEKNGVGREAEFVRIKLKEEAERKAILERDFGPLMREKYGQKRPGAEAVSPIGYLRGFMASYEVDEKGEPTTGTEYFKGQCQRVADALTSENVETKTKELDHIASIVATASYKQRDFVPGYFLANFAAIHKQATSSYAWLSSVESDHPDYIAKMKPEKLQSLNDMKPIVKAYWVMYCSTLTKMNCNPATGEPYSKDDEVTRKAQEELYGEKAHADSLATLERYNKKA